MNNELKEIVVIERAVRNAQEQAVQELSELQLAMVGGGIADVIAG